MGHRLSKRSRRRGNALLEKKPTRFKSLSLSPKSGTITRRSHTYSAGARRGKTYGSLRLKGKTKKSSIPDKSVLSSYDMEEKEGPGRRVSEIRERDTFLDLLSKVQDNRYDNQRYSIKAGVTSNPEPDDVFEESKSSKRSSLILTENGIMSNGTTPVHGSKGGAFSIPTVEVTGSPSSIPRKIKKASSVGSVSAISEDSRNFNEGRPCSADSRAGGSKEEERTASQSPTYSSTTVSTLSPSRKCTETLQKTLANGGPYPLLIDASEGGFWIQNGEYQSAFGEDGVWRAPEISTEHYTIQTDKSAFVYGRYFTTQKHENYIGQDHKHGPVILSLKIEEDYQGTLARILLRTQKETIYKIIPGSQLPAGRIEPEGYIKIASRLHGDEISVDKVTPILDSKATDLLQKFDEYPLAKTHKFGVIYQQYGQACEEDLFGNCEHPESLDEFLTMLGDKVELEGFRGYRGGLDVTNNQTGDESFYTEFKDRRIMFHVSTLLPHDQGDTQYVQRKRHIGNDIVVIIFQEANTPFCPDMIRSHFIHSYIVVQVEHPNTDHTVYKVAVAAKDQVPDFGPALPDPAIFQKGSEFRDWLLIKALNAEFNCHQASSFKKLATRTRNQLFLHLVESLAKSIDDVDGTSLSRELTSSLEYGQTVSPDVNQLSRRKKRRKTLTEMFSNKRDIPYGSPSTHLMSSKRKSVSSSPKAFRKIQQQHNHVLHPQHTLAGSTSDLVEEVEKGDKENGQKGNIVRRFTFKRNQENDKGKLKTPRKPKRTSSVNSPAGFTIANYMHRNKNVLKTSTSFKGHDSSDESSILSEMNLGGSVPFDLPGTVETECDTRLEISFSNPTVLDRSESALSLQDIDISLHHPRTIDVAVQCTPEGSSITHYHSPCSSPPRRVANSEHSRRLHSVNPLKTYTSPNHTQSMPTTPIRIRKVSLQESYSHKHRNSGRRSPTLPFMLEHSRHRFRNQTLVNGSRDILEQSKILSNFSMMSSSSDHQDKVDFYRVKSTESIAADTDMYSSLLLSLEAATAEVARLRERNFDLIRENVKFASQNHNIKTKYSEMKESLAEARSQIIDLQDRLHLCEPQTSVLQD